MDVKLPKLGEGADSGVVVNVFVKEGDPITEGQTIIELENEKAVAPIPATVSGKVTKVRIKEGDKISVGQVILTVEPGGAEARPAKEQEAVAGAAKPTQSSPAEDALEPPQEEDLTGEVPVKSASEIAAAPSIRKLARDLGIDLGRVRGSERGGRIALADVRAYIQRLQALALQPRAAAAGAPVKPELAQAEAADFSKWGPITKKPLSQLRKTIGRRMSESWVSVPRVTQFDEADISGLMELRKKYHAAYEAHGARLTLTPFVLKALAAALKKHPLFNASLDEAGTEIVVKEYYHIGLAVDTEAGLLVPVIRDVDKKGLLQLSKEVEECAVRARERKLSLEEMKGGTFTVSNQGGIGGGHFTPIVNLPEVGILGLGRGALKAVVKEGKILPRLMMPMAISYDHRVIDGGVAARFTVDLVGELEEFPEAEVEL